MPIGHAEHAVADEADQIDVGVQRREREIVIRAHADAKQHADD